MKKKWWDDYMLRLLHWRPVRTILYWSRRVIIPGFQGVPLFDVTVFFVQGLRKGALSQRAAALSFHFFLSVFPTLLAFFSLLAYIPIDHLNDDILLFLGSILPDGSLPFLHKVLDGIAVGNSGELLSISMIAALSVAASGVNAIIRSFNQSQHVIENRNWIKQRITSFLLLLLILVLIVVSFILIVIYKKALLFLIEEEVLRKSLYPMLIVGKWFVLIALTYFTVSILYYFGPSNRSDYRFFSAGSSLATGLFLLLTSGFSFYITNISRYNALYGSIGILIVIMLWLYLNAHILLIGFELNASIVDVNTCIAAQRQETDDVELDGKPRLKLRKTSYAQRLYQMSKPKGREKT